MLMIVYVVPLHWMLHSKMRPSAKVWYESIVVERLQRIPRCLVQIAGCPQFCVQKVGSSGECVSWRQSRSAEIDLRYVKIVCRFAGSAIPRTFSVMIVNFIVYSVDSVRCLVPGLNLRSNKLLGGVACSPASVRVLVGLLGCDGEDVVIVRAVVPSVAVILITIAVTLSIPS